MPLYEYTCKECGAHFEKMVRFSEGDLIPECPECHSAQTEKQISAFAAFSALVNGGGSSSSSGSCSPRGRFT